MRTVEIGLKGTSPLLMHAYPMVAREGLEKASPEDQAEHHTYRTPDPRRALYVPGVNIQRGLVAAASFSKGKGRASLQKTVAAAVEITTPYCEIAPQTYTVDSRPVVIPATKGRVVRHRACFPQWQIGCALNYDETMLSEAQLRRVFDDLGRLVGILDFRPAKLGWFGRFMVIDWRGG